MLKGLKVVSSIEKFITHEFDFFISGGIRGGVSEVRRVILFIAGRPSPIWLGRGGEAAAVLKL